MKKTRLPKSARPLAEYALTLSREISRLEAHFQNPGHSHNDQAKRKLERLINRRGLALESLKMLDRVLHQLITRQIRGGTA